MEIPQIEILENGKKDLDKWIEDMSYFAVNNSKSKYWVMENIQKYLFDKENLFLSKEYIGKIVEDITDIW